MNINYALIGSIPSVERYRDTLPAMMEQVLVLKAVPKRSDAFIEDEKFSEQDARRDTILQLEIVIEQCAEHFYGIELDDYQTIEALIEAINGMDQGLELA